MDEAQKAERPCFWETRLGRGLALTWTLGLLVCAEGIVHGWLWP